ncbi:amino acid adenylation domain-containing protein [Streptomyces sp. NPDC050504]|uniref:amino acid adenylation domain-containing protein n=1 Tax=Streptomyces sp. NPDC050504 TaxID=3365618 RepID=UPI003799BD5F
MTTDLFSKLTTLSPQQQRLLRERLAQTQAPARPAPRADTHQGDVPLSHAQLRMWLINRFEPEDLGYNQIHALRLRGPLDRDALEQAFTDLVERHAVLRTVYPETGGVPRQEVLATARCGPLLTVHRPRDAGEEGVRQALADANLPFDLTRDIPLRARLVERGPDDHVLHLLIHHIATDWHSDGIVRRDLWRAYAARSRGHAPDWAPPELSYADYTLWHRDRLGSEEDPGSPLARQLSHWAKRLEGLPAELALPTDRPRPQDGVSGAAGASRHFRVGAGLHARLAELAGRQGATLFMVVQAAVAALLTRLGAGTDVPLCAPVSGRADARLDGTVGFFVNTLVLRADTSGDPGLRELVRRVRERTLDAYAHQDIPFERVVEAVNPERVPGRHPLAQVMVSLRGPSTGAEGLPGLTAEEIATGTGVVHFDLMTAFVEHTGPGGEPAGLDIELGYKTALFDTGSAIALGERLIRLLTAAAAEPDRPLSTLDLLGDQERDRVLTAARGPRHPAPDGSLPVLFRAQAARTPDAVALSTVDQRLTYARLDAWSDALAHALADAGAGAEDRVGLLMDRTPAAVATLLAILKAGAAYVPLRTADPDERLADLVAASGVRLVAAGPGPARPLGVPVLTVDPAPVTDRPFPLPDTHPDQLAYVMHTSGSTGTPKGVAVTHRNIADLTADPRWAGPAHRTVLVHSPLAFDASTYEIWVPLLTGGRAHLAPPGDLDLPELARALKDGGVTAAGLTAGLFQVVADVAPQYLSGLREVIAGGDVVPAGAVARALAANPGLTVAHAYGPTETTTFASVQPFTAGDVRPGEARLPLGGPLANTGAYVLDEHLRLCPPGVPGELYLTGPGVARGYLGHPGLTSERFVPCPSGAPGERMYRTGDLARLRPDGLLDFLGRGDTQAKVRGYRVEPEEIRHALAALPGVRQAVVTVREDRPGDKRIVAHVVPDEDPEHGGFDAEALRAALAARLPDYQVPDAIVALERLPLTANGKVDHRALPAPRWAEPAEDAADGGQPATATERRLCELFGEVLGTGPVSVRQSFFAAGGNSLLVMRLCSLIREEYGHGPAAREVFARPTPAALAALLDAAPATADTDPASGAAAPVLAPAPRDAEPVLAPVQHGLWFLHQLDGYHSAYNVPAALRLTGRVDLRALLLALRDTVGRHDALRTLLPADDGRPAPRVLPATCPVDLHLTAADPALLPELLTAERAPAFDLGTDLPLRARLFDLTGPDDAAEQYVLSLVFHHLAVDGWSMDVLWADLADAYRARTRGRAPDWTPLPLGYRDYAHWQHALVGPPEEPTELAGLQLDHWRTALDGAPDELALPYDRRRTEHSGPEGATHHLRLDAALHARLTALAGSQDATLFMAVQAAVAALLTRLGAGTDIPLGTPVAGRTDARLAGTVGFFVNTLVLRTDTSGDPGFAELLRRVRDTALDAYAHQDVPFERVVEALNPARVPGRHPLFQVMINHTGAGAGAREHDFPGLGAQALAAESRTSHFDLLFTCSEEPGTDGAPAGLGIELGYRTALFDPETVAAIGTRLVRLLTGAADAPDRPLSALDLLGDGERARVLAAARGPAHPAPEASVPASFRAQAARTPEAVALSADGVRWTYAELDAWSDRTAHALTARGTGAEDRVGVLMDRGPATVAALLAILKTGAAYVPLRTADPAESLAETAENAGLRLIVTDSAHHDRATGLGIPVHTVPEADGHHPAGLPAPVTDRPFPLPDTHPDQLAYVMHTSGSTGIPKGVAVTHRSIADLAADPHWAREAHRTVLVHSPLAFDASTYEMWVPLLTGGRAHVAPAGELSLAALTEALRDHGVSAAWLTAGLLQVVADEAPDALSGLREVWSGGDVVPPEAVRRVTAACPELTVVNGYGPTETTTFAAVHTVRPGDLAEDAVRLPLGSPLANSGTYVLDDRMRPCPPGVPGELYLTGPGLARGYLRRPALTAERFVSFPHGAPGERMYRTGDLVRLRPDGLLDFLGRSDRQVKVRGFRIEPEEIQHALAALPGVRQAVVTVRESGPGDKRIVAHVVPVPGDTAPDTEALRAATAARLPSYLVPDAFVVLQRLPLTPNGKVDLRALPEPRWTDESEGAVAPATPVERTLCALFGRLLGVPPVSAVQNFFTAGGSSLMVMRLCSLIRKEFQQDLTARQVYDNPTPVALAVLIEAAAQEGRAARAPLAPAPEGAALVIAPAQQGLWFLHQLDGFRSAYNVPAALRFGEPLDAIALADALYDTVARHDALRTLIPDLDGEPAPRTLAPDALPALLTRTDTTEDALPALLEAERHWQFDLTAQLPVRARLLRLTDSGADVLSLVFPHLVMDGWSLDVFWADLATAYRARAEGRAPGWEPLPVGYTDYAHWHHTLLGPPEEPTEFTTAQLDHWRTALKGAPVELPLPYDHPRPSARALTTRVLTARWDAATLAGIDALAERTHASLLTVSQAAVAALLSRVGGGDDIPLGTPVSGRSDEALSGVVGHFVNTLVLRVDTGGDPDPDELVSRTHQVALTALGHQDMPFDRLVLELRPPRRVNRNPLFQTMVSFSPAGSGEAPRFGADPGESLSAEPDSAKFDLAFEFVDRRDGEDGALECRICYCPELFDAATAQRVVDELHDLVREFAAQPAN